MTTETAYIFTFPSGISVTVETEMEDIKVDREPRYLPRFRRFYVNGREVSQAVAELTVNMHRGMKP